MNTTDPQNELLTEVNSKNEVIGPITREKTHNNRSGYYRTICVFVKNSDNQYLWQKRSSSKDLYPNCWDFSVGGHVAFGDDYVDTAVRELSEELGINCTQEELDFKGEVLVNLPSSNEFFHVFEYLLKASDVLNLKNDEVEQVKWIEMSKAKESMNSKTLEWYPRPIQVVNGIYFKNANRELIAQTEQFAEPLCRQYAGDPGLWEDHVRLVRQYALLLGIVENADLLVVEVAAILHDIGKCKGREGHAERGYELAMPFINAMDLEEEKKELILKCILKHGSKSADEENKIEVKVIQCADALGTFFDEKYQEYSRETMNKEVLLGLYEKTFNKINLNSAREMVRTQVEKLKKTLIAR